MGLACVVVRPEGIEPLKNHYSQTHWLRSFLTVTCLGNTLTQIFRATYVQYLYEVSRVLFLGLCPDFHYFSTGVVFPKFGFDFSRRAVAQALVEP